MSDKLARRILLGAFLVSLLSVPALQAGGTQVTIADAVWDFEEDQEGAIVGESVSATGDFNNDGYYDVVVGARFYSYDAGGGPIYRSGGAWLFYGTVDGPSAVPSLFLVPPYLNSSGYFGEAVATANVDGDDYDDLIISMQNYDNTHSDEGAVFLYYGSATGIDGSYDWMARGAYTWGHFGVDVASAGDIDNDGYDDLIVGARRYDTCSPLINHAYVFMGSATGLGADKTAAEADWYAMGDECNPSLPSNKDGGFGINVGSAGDVNGDGYDDIFVGAPLQDSGQADEGKIFVWHGSMTGLGDTGSPSNADWTAESDMASVYFPDYSRTVAGSGDFNGDGYEDFIAGTRYYDHMQTDDGIALVWYGSETGLGPNGNPSNADWLAYGSAMHENFASNLVVLDYNGDGYDDVLIGGLGHIVNSQVSTGMAALWFGTEDGLGIGGPSYYADWMAEGDPQAQAYFGWSLSAGDTDNDGYEDPVIGAPYCDLVNKDAGKVWAFPGEPVIFSENFESGDTLRLDQQVP